MILYERNVDYRQIFIDGRPLPADRIRLLTATRPGSGTGIRWLSKRLGSETTSGSMLPAIRLLTPPRSQNGSAGRISGILNHDHCGRSQSLYSPWTVELHQHLKPDTDLLEYFCENEKSLSHLVGK